MNCVSLISEIMSHIGIRFLTMEKDFKTYLDEFDSVVDDEKTVHVSNITPLYNGDCQIDALVAPIVTLLNNYGLKTVASCSGHVKRKKPTGYLWIDTKTESYSKTFDSLHSLPSKVKGVYIDTRSIEDGRFIYRWNCLGIPFDSLKAKLRRLLVELASIVEKDLQ